MSELATWLSAELERRGWSIRELARRADISHASISSVISGQYSPSWDFCASIAPALDRQVEDVFRLAGLLPSLPSPVAEEQEAVAILRELSAGELATVMRMLRGLAGQLQKEAVHVE